MPQPGFFILHASAKPPLKAGNYTLQGTQEVAGGPTAPYAGHLRVTSPRFRMPPDQILSTFPPANGEGSFDSRLPQVVLRRRTLPWERLADPAHPDTPWLALVVIAEGEGTLSGDTPVHDCISPGVQLLGTNDVASGIYLSVTQTVVNAVFPALDDLPLLAHVREVDLNDTELALGDDDGFIAVVLANRLPQFDRKTCSPIRYMACLINLEGQLAALPQPPPAVNIFNAVAFVQDVRVEAAKLSLAPDHFVMGQGTPGAPAGAPQGRFVAPASSGLQQRPDVQAASWATRQNLVGNVAVSASPAEAGRLVRDAMAEGFRLPLELIFAERVYRFPVLAHWSFTSTGAASFRTLMQGLDVGLLGTLPADPQPQPKPACAPPEKGDAPPPAPPPRPAPELTETGHVGLPHVTRRGDALRAWYRGPFTLHITTRLQTDASGKLQLAHTSDQLRRIVPDGREDLSLAAAFEIGRLLALSQPSVVAGFMRWRQEQFGAERARQLAAAAIGALTTIKPALQGRIQDLGHLVGKQLTLAAAGAPQKVFAPNRPLADPGRPLRYLTGNLDDIIASGFGIQLDTVRTATSALGVAAALSKISVPQAGTRFDSTANANLRAGLSAAVERLASGALKGPSGPAAFAPATAADALDDLLATASRGKETKS
jgi:hypothetical protein